MQPILFTPEADQEVTSAQDWYERQAPGLGRRFRSELAAAVERIGANPQQFPAVFAGLRRTIVHDFPYGLYFRVEPDAIVVIACFHSHRDPTEWQRRI